MLDALEADNNPSLPTDVQNVRTSYRIPSELILTSQSLFPSTVYHELAHWRFTTYTALTTLLLGDPKDPEDKRKKLKIHQPIKKHADQDNKAVSEERRMALRHAYRDRCVTESARCIAKLKASGKIRTLTREFDDLLKRSRAKYAKD